MNKRVISIIAAILIILGNGGMAFARGMGGGGGGGGGHFGGGGFGGGGGHFGGGGFGGGGFGGGGDHGWGGGGFGGGGDHGWGGGGGDHGWSGGGGDHGWGGGGGDHGWSGGGGDHGWSGGDHNWGNQGNWGFGRISGNNVFNAGHNTFNYSPTYMRNSGALVRNNYYGGHAFWGGGWWGYHPGCWCCPYWGMGMGTAWMITSWASMAGMLALDAAVQPSYYGYGTNITYNNNNVYYDGQQYASADDYYNQAQTLATSGSNDTSDKNVEWKPLGVFSLVQGQQTNSNMLFQLAIDKKGDIGGNYYDVLTDETQPVQGKLDKKNQRVAWTIGKNQNVVYDSGLGNLMAEQAPLLVHFGKDRTEQWLLVRLKHDQGDPGAEQKNADSNTLPGVDDNSQSNAGNSSPSQAVQDDTDGDPEI